MLHYVPYTTQYKDESGIKLLKKPLRTKCGDVIPIVPARGRQGKENHKLSLSHTVPFKQTSRFMRIMDHDS